MDFHERMRKKVALGHALRQQEQDAPGLMTLPRLRDLYAAGEMSLEEYESGVARVLERERTRADRVEP